MSEIFYSLVTEDLDLFCPYILNRDTIRVSVHSVLSKSPCDLSLEMEGKEDNSLHLLVPRLDLSTSGPSSVLTTTRPSYPSSYLLVTRLDLVLLPPNPSPLKTFFTPRGIYRLPQVVVPLFSPSVYHLDCPTNFVSFSIYQYFYTELNFITR